MIAAYFSLTKPRMVLGNVIVAAAAFIFGSPATIDWEAFALMAAGLSLVIGAGCVLNNYYDRNIDARMERTKGRVLAMGRIDAYHALAFGAALLVLGAVLLAQINQPALWTALFAAAAYVLAYTPMKHKSGYALYVGAIAGAMPPVIGYVAATGALDWTAGALFALLYLWQLPHFMAIAIYRFDEYAAAGVPLLVRGPHSAAARKRARLAFYASLVILLLFCVGLIVQRWTR